NLPAGTYTLTIGPFDDEFNFGGDAEASGDLDIENVGAGMTGVSIVGAGSGTTIIQMGTLSPAGSGTGAGIVKDRILEVNDFITAQRGLVVSLSGVTLTNAVSPSTAAPDNYKTPGGAIMFDGFDQPSTNPTGTLTLTNVVVTANTAGGQGGGMTTVDASLTLNTSTVSTNTATSANGGGISYNGGNKIAGQTLTLTTSTISGNTAANATFGIGGGIATFGGAGVTIQTNSVISNNIGNAQDAAGPDAGGGGILFGNPA